MNTTDNAFLSQHDLDEVNRVIAKNHAAHEKLNAEIIRKIKADKLMTDNAFPLETKCATPDVIPALLVALVMLAACAGMLIALVKPILDAIDGR